MRNSVLNQPYQHDSAQLYVTGRAEFIDDIGFAADSLYIALGLSSHARAAITAIDLDAVYASDGVVSVLTAKDILGDNDASPAAGDDPVFAEDEVYYHGQCIFAVVAKTAKQARQATGCAKISYAEKAACLTIDDALASDNLLQAPHTMKRGDAVSSLSKSTHRLSGKFYVGGQEHFYLEGQAALAIPDEDNGVSLFVSTQHPTEIQHKVAAALAIPYHSVTVQVRRMGGGFGGKESQANLPAIIAALAARKTGRVCKLVYDRDEDMRVTGKRHDILIHYDVGFEADGQITAMKIDQALRCGMSFDLSMAIGDRAMMHAENAYFIENVEITAKLCRTNTPSNTAFRGFGGPQGMIGMERVIDEVAAHLDIDPVLVRKRNFYADKDEPESGQLTPYYQPIKDGLIKAITNQLCDRSDYVNRRIAIEAEHKTNPLFYRGIALTPVKFGISFTKTIFNQAGALIHIYTDGSVHLNHGGTEMGQGLYTKTAQICASVFDIDLAQVKITAAHTGKVPNTSATAASSGTDLNGMATARAAETLKSRMANYLAPLYQAHPDQVIFKEGKLLIGSASLSFAEAANLCWQGRISLSATGYYATPDIHWDRDKGQGSPFYYFAYGAAIAEVAIDRLTGENRVLRIDILHDAGQSINPALDKGQIEGGFIQGMGWLTTEELVYGQDGRLQTHSPSTYKIPACSDRPYQMNIDLFDSGGNPADTIHKSKAVGEPPFMLAISVHNALCHALKGINGVFTCLDAPATAEQILMRIDENA